MRGALDTLLLFLPPFFWSTNFIVGKALVGAVPPWTLNTGRFVVAALILVPLALYRREWRPVPQSARVPILLMSLTGVFAFNAVLYIGLHHTSAINATLVNSATPVTTACLAWLLIAEKMTLRRLAGTIISFSGVAWIVTGGSPQRLYDLSLNPGDVLVFCATALWGFYSVMAKKLMGQLSTLKLTARTTAIGSIFLLPAALLELAVEPSDLGRIEVPLAFVYLGVFPTFIAFLLWTRSVLRFGPGRASLVYNTLPLFAVILSVIFLGETLKAYQIGAGAVIIAGVVLGTRD